MITWPDIEAAAKRAGWQRIGREYRGAPCPSCGGGAKRSAWVQPLGDSWGGGCHASGCTGLAVARALTAHLAAVAGDETAPVRGPLRRSGSGGGVPSGGVAKPHTIGGAARCAAVWAASVSTDRTAGAIYLVRRGVWPAGERLPAAVRWLPATSAACLQPRRLPSGAAGVLCFLFAKPGEADPAAIQCEAVNASGERAAFGGGVKRPSVGGSDFGGGRRVLVASAGDPDRGGVHLCEGPLDALALVHLARLGAVDLAGAAVIGAAGTSGFTTSAVATWPTGPVTLWPDGDHAGELAAVELAAALKAAGRECSIRTQAPGLDLADWAAEAAIEREGMRDG